MRNEGGNEETPPRGTVTLSRQIGHRIDRHISLETGGNVSLL